MQALSDMLNTLEAHKLEVQLAPSRRRDRRDSDMIRVVVDHGPRWYRRMCAAHTSSRGIRRGKHDTKLKHANVVSVLRVLVSGRASVSKYAPELRRIARQLK